MANDCLSTPYPNPSMGQMVQMAQETNPGPSSSRKPERQSRRQSRPSRSSRRHRVRGARQAILIVSLLTGLLFSTIDTSIVATSLMTISNDYGDFINAPWVVLAYLLTYMGCAVWIAKLSDIYGRRNMLAVSWVVFVAFSFGCGQSQDMVALITCRAFQGLGASGMYSLTQIGLVEVGPAHKPSLIGAMIGATLAVAFILGPIIGGAVTQLSDWRWLFNINIPFGLVTILSICSLWPKEEAESLLSWNALKRIDVIGSVTLLSSSGLLVFAIQQAGSQVYAWSSPAIISALVFSWLSWAAFAAWEIFVGIKQPSQIEPVFPIRLTLCRVYSAGLLVTLLTGFPYVALTIVIPERFQIVNGENALMAGVHILPLLGACATGSFLGGAISSKRNNTSVTLILASCLQLLGVGLMMLITSEKSRAPEQYAFQAIFGLGVGLSFSAATIMTNIMASADNERASAQGAVAQARVLGGCIGLSICTVIFNAHVNKYLDSQLSDQELENLHRTPLSALQLPVDKQTLIRDVYSGAFREEIRIMILICVAMVFISLFTFERNPAPLERLTQMAKDGPVSSRGSESGIELIEAVSSQRQFRQLVIFNLWLQL